MGKDAWIDENNNLKEYSTSSTILNLPYCGNRGSVLSAVVDTWENCHVPVMDVPGVFMQTDMDEVIQV